MPHSLRRIQRRDPPSDASLAALRGTMSPLMARVLAARGVTSVDELDIDLRRLLSPAQMLGMNAAVTVLADAVQRGARVLVIGDYDADGATSTALCVSTLRAFGGNADFLVPDRFKFGYGLTPEIVDVAVEREPAVILTVDNGIASIDGVRRANETGIRVVVTDHHLPGAELPAAAAIVNPNQPGCTFASKAIAGVGVAFCVMSALRSELRARGWFNEKRVEPNLADALDLVALGTVADVVPLDANNRILVAQGVRRMRAGRIRPGIAALMAVAKRSHEKLVAADLGFGVAPRLNAAGRLNDMSHGIRCLLAQDDGEAQRFASELDAMNLERRTIESGMQQDAIAALSRLKLDEGSLPQGVCLFDRHWHQGVIGIVASRIKERVHRPVVAFAPADTANTGAADELRGSARSIEGLHIRDVIDAVATRYPALIKRFGGHAMAAGLTIARRDYDAFAKAFDEEIRRISRPEQFSPVLMSDGELPLSQLDLPLARSLREAMPWGQAFPAPIFDGEFDVLESRIVGERHLKFVLSTPESRGRVVDAIWFGADFERWQSGCKRARIAYRVDVNDWKGVGRPQFIVEWLECL